MENSNSNTNMTVEHGQINAYQYPVQAFVDKVAKNKAWAVLSSIIDFDAKCIHYHLAKDDTHVVDEDISFDDACKMFGWNGFTVNDIKTILYPIIEGHELPKTEDGSVVEIDTHFGESGYDWMSENRITNPMNNSTEGIADINAQLHSNGGVYYGKFSHPIGDDFIDGIVLAQRETTPAEY